MSLDSICASAAGPKTSDRRAYPRDTARESSTLSTRRSGARFAPSRSRRSVQTAPGRGFETPRHARAPAPPRRLLKRRFKLGSRTRRTLRPTLSIKGHAGRGGAQIYVPQGASAKSTRPSVGLTRASSVVSSGIRMHRRLRLVGRAQRHPQQVTGGTRDVSQEGECTSHDRWMARAGQTASTTPNGQASCGKP